VSGGVTYTDIKGSVIVALLFWFTPLYIALMYVKTDLSLLNIVKIVLLFIGVFFAMLSQHMLHRLVGVSSVKQPTRKEQFIVPLTIASLIAVALTVVSTHLIWVWIAIGAATMFAYSLTRRFWYSNEILVGIAWSAVFFGAYTTLTHNLLPPANVALIFIALAVFYGVIAFCYRVITGDYGCPIPRSVVNKLIVQLFIGTMLLGLAISL
jgi:hypothetical protein